MIQILQHPNKQIIDFLKYQNLDNSQKYINSIYTTKVYDFKDLIIENILTGEIIVQSLPLDINDDTFLIAHWFKIPENFDIYNLYKKIQNKLNKSKNNYNNYSLLNNFSKAILFSTLGCNANCNYCYEKEYRNKKYSMTKEVVDDFINLLIKNNQKSIEISWFGGEPMFNDSIIDYTYEQLQKYNISYKTSMISNGLLFNKEKIIKAKNKWKLEHLQITLDGIGEYYEKVKDVHQGSFQNLLNNIECFLKEKISVNFRLNLSQDNYYHLKKTIKLLYDNFSQYRNFSINIHELFGIEYEKNTYINLLKLNLYMESLFKNKNFKWREFKWRNRGCMADGNTTITILPDGKVALCEHNAIKDYYTDLKRNFYNIDIINNYANYSDRKECQLCPLRPGCIYNVNCPADGGNNCNKNRVQFLLYFKKKMLIKLAQKKRKRRKHLMITKELYTNIDIYNKATALIEAFNTQDSSNLNYPVKINFYLQKNMNTLINLAREIEQKRIEIVQKFGTKKEDSDEYTIPEDKVAEASQELQDFFDLEQEVPINMMKLEWFDKIDMTAAQVNAISFMIEEEE